jgi:predicted Zn-dependent protease
MEAQIGNAIHHQIIKTMSVYQEPALNEYVRSIGEKLTAHAERKDLVYQFVILEDDRIYSIYAPGGYVYITTGFFKFLHNEIELAGILAYEIAMLQYKDPRLSKFKKAFELLLQTGSQAAPAFGTIGALSVLGLVLIGHFTLSEKILVDRIKEADQKTLQYLVESNYDPQGFIEPLYRMNDSKSQYRAYLYDYLESHPITPKRLEELDQAFRKLPLENKQFNVYRETYLTKTEVVRNTLSRK